MDLRFKSRKLRFYAGGLASLMLPDGFYRQRLERELNALPVSEIDALLPRVDYYNRLAVPFEPGETAVRIGDFRYERRGAYFLDAKQVARHFDPEMRFAYRFGDVTWNCEHPAFVKSRPICREAHDGQPSNANNLLLKLNSVRHFHFVDDRLRFADKKPGVVWRGKCFHEHRAAVLREFCDHPRMDIGQSHAERRHQRDYRPFLSIGEQLRYKFVLSLEARTSPPISSGSSPRTRSVSCHRRDSKPGSWRARSSPMCTTCRWPKTAATSRRRWITTSPIRRRPRQSSIMPMPTWRSFVMPGVNG